MLLMFVLTYVAIVSATKITFPRDLCVDVHKSIYQAFFDEASQSEDVIVLDSGDIDMRAILQSDTTILEVTGAVGDLSVSYSGPDSAENWMTVRGSSSTPVTLTLKSTARGAARVIYTTDAKLTACCMNAAEQASMFSMGGDWINDYTQECQDMTNKYIQSVGRTGRQGGGFDFGSDCLGGTGRFEVNLTKARDTAELPGFIPVDKWGVRVQLYSTNDIDVQLFDMDYTVSYVEGAAIVAYCEEPVCNRGDPLGPNPEVMSTNYRRPGMTQDLAIEYSGYNGVNSLGNEYIEITGPTPINLKMRVYAYSVGMATVQYAWQRSRTACCLGIERCPGEPFSAPLVKDELALIGSIPVGKTNVRIDIKGSGDVDIQLYDVNDNAKWSEGKALVGYCGPRPGDSECNLGTLSGPGRQELTLDGVTYIYSGYNGKVYPDGRIELGEEYIEILGTTNRPLMMMAFGYSAGSADVTYSWFEPLQPTSQPTMAPTGLPTGTPTRNPTMTPTTLAPTVTNQPTSFPTNTPTRVPTRAPTTVEPTAAPTPLTEAAKWANNLEDKGVKLLAIDFDYTACRIHAYGGNFVNFASLASCLTPDFISLSTEWCRRGGDDHFTAIVTYNDGTMYVGGQPMFGPTAIARVLTMVLPAECSTPKKYPVYAKNYGGGSVEGKNPHLTSAKNDIQSWSGVSLKNNEVILIEDSSNNIRRAEPFGYQTAFVYPYGFAYANLE